MQTQAKELVPAMGPARAIRPAAWSVEYLFHAPNCDLHLAVGNFLARTHAERVAAETPTLHRVDADFYLTLHGQSYLAPSSSVVMHGDPLGAQVAAADFAFVDGWVFPAIVAATPCDAYVREVSRYWRALGAQAHPRPSLREALLWHFRHARLRQNASGGRLDVYYSCGKRVDDLLDELVHQQWLCHDDNARGGEATLRATTRLLTVWPLLDAEDHA